MVSGSSAKIALQHSPVETPRQTANRRSPRQRRNLAKQRGYTAISNNILRHLTRKRRKPTTKQNWTNYRKNKKTQRHGYEFLSLQLLFVSQLAWQLLLAVF